MKFYLKKIFTLIITLFAVSLLAFWVQYLVFFRCFFLLLGFESLYFLLVSLMRRLRSMPSKRKKQRKNTRYWSQRSYGSKKRFLENEL